MEEDHVINQLPLPGSSTILYHCGPELLRGQPRPACFYFALSGAESLGSDPYNQPIAPLNNAGIHTFSLTLPHHGTDLSPKEALPIWTQRLLEGSPFLDEFFNLATAAVDYCITEGYTAPGKIAASGLSRGGFIAAHLTARHPAITHLLAFAPLTTFDHMEPFSTTGTPPAFAAYALTTLCDRLWNRSVCIYIGNRDMRVGSRSCFDFVDTLVNSAYQHGVRSPPIELHLVPSIGFRGHGTNVHSFTSGAQWLSEQLE